MKTENVLAAIATGYLAARVAAALAQTLRQRLFQKVMSFYSQELERFSTASLITGSPGDVSQVQMLVAMGLQIITKTPVMMVWGLTKIVGKQWSLTTGLAVLVLPRFKIIQRYRRPEPGHPGESHRHPGHPGL